MQKTLVGGFPNSLPRRSYAALGPAADNAVSLLCIGSLENKHGLYNAIHAVQLSRIRRVPSRLVLAGCGSSVNDLRCFARGLQADDDVVFVDPVVDTEKRSLFAVSDALLV